MFVRTKFPGKKKQVSLEIDTFEIHSKLNMRKVLVIGAGGQIGTELVEKLRQKYGKGNVFAADLREECPERIADGPYVKLDVLDEPGLRKLVLEEQFSDVYLLAALLSAVAEKKPAFAWKLNMDGLFNVLNLAKEGLIKQVYWPSSIAVFGPTTPRDKTPQTTVMEPTTVYGISKLAGERWCQYYRQVYNVDVRSIRYPGLISYTSLPGGGTTDYAVDIFYQARIAGKYTCFLSEDTYLPMLYMEDAINATIQLMETPKEKLITQSAYNIGGLSFSPQELAEEIAKKMPFEISYEPDFRQDIANSWPKSINADVAREEWGYKMEYDLEKMVDIMLKNLEPKKLLEKSSEK